MFLLVLESFYILLVTKRRRQSSFSTSQQFILMTTSSRISTKILMFLNKKYCFIIAFSVQQSKRKLTGDIRFVLHSFLMPAL